MIKLTLSARQTKVYTFENIVDPEETAHNEPSYHDLDCHSVFLLLFFD